MSLYYAGEWTHPTRCQLLAQIISLSFLSGHWTGNVLNIVLMSLGPRMVNISHNLKPGSSITFLEVSMWSDTTHVYLSCKGLQSVVTPLIPGPFSSSPPSALARHAGSHCVALPLWHPPPHYRCVTEDLLNCSHCRLSLKLPGNSPHTPFPHWACCCTLGNHSAPCGGTPVLSWIAPHGLPLSNPGDCVSPSHFCLLRAWQWSCHEYVPTMCFCF